MFNDIKTLMPKPAPSGGKEAQNFLKSTSTKVNVIARLEFELFLPCFMNALHGR